MLLFYCNNIDVKHATQYYSEVIIAAINTCQKANLYLLAGEAIRILLADRTAYFLRKRYGSNLNLNHSITLEAVTSLFKCYRRSSLAFVMNVAIV